MLLVNVALSNRSFNVAIPSGPRATIADFIRQVGIHVSPYIITIHSNRESLENSMKYKEYVIYRPSTISRTNI